VLTTGGRWSGLAVTRPAEELLGDGTDVRRARPVAALPYRLLLYVVVLAAGRMWLGAKVARAEQIPA
jgi:hypothetical protein